MRATVEASAASLLSRYRAAGLSAKSTEPVSAEQRLALNRKAATVRRQLLALDITPELHTMRHRLIEAQLKLRIVTDELHVERESSAAVIDSARATEVALRDASGASVGAHEALELKLVEANEAAGAIALKLQIADDALRVERASSVAILDSAHDTQRALKEARNTSAAMRKALEVKTRGADVERRNAVQELAASAARESKLKMQLDDAHTHQHHEATQRRADALALDALRASEAEHKADAAQLERALTSERERGSAVAAHCTRLTAELATQHRGLLDERERIRNAAAQHERDIAELETLRASATRHKDAIATAQSALANERDRTRGAMVAHHAELAASLASNSDDATLIATLESQLTEAAQLRAAASEQQQRDRDSASECFASLSSRHAEEERSFAAELAQLRVREVCAADQLREALLLQETLITRADTAKRELSTATAALRGDAAEAHAAEKEARAATKSAKASLRATLAQRQHAAIAELQLRGELETCAEALRAAQHAESAIKLQAASAAQRAARLQKDLKATKEELRHAVAACAAETARASKSSKSAQAAMKNTKAARVALCELQHASAERERAYAAERQSAAVSEAGVRGELERAVADRARVEGELSALRYAHAELHCASTTAVGDLERALAVEKRAVAVAEEEVRCARAELQNEHTRVVAEKARREAGEARLIAITRDLATLAASRRATVSSRPAMIGDEENTAPDFPPSSSIAPRRRVATERSSHLQLAETPSPLKHQQRSVTASAVMTRRDTARVTVAAPPHIQKRTRTSKPIQLKVSARKLAQVKTMLDKAVDRIATARAAGDTPGGDLIAYATALQAAVSRMTT